LRDQSGSPCCQGESRDEALENIRDDIALWLEVEAEEAGVKSVETFELAL
jgi:predicted RNase H-like HicB family nuclease